MILGYQCLPPEIMEQYENGKTKLSSFLFTLKLRKQVVYDKQTPLVNLKIATFQDIWYNLLITVIETAFNNCAQLLPDRI